MLSCFSYVQLFVTLLTIARQATLSTGFSRQEYWTGLPCPPPGNLPHPGIEPLSFKSPALTGRFFTTIATWGKTAPLTWEQVSYLGRSGLQGGPRILLEPEDSRAMLRRNWSLGEGKIDPLHFLLKGCEILQPGDRLENVLYSSEGAAYV